MKADERTEAGFTLMELLVVLAIVGLLSALLLSALASAKGFARSTVCKNHLHQLGLALQMYVHDNQSKYPHYLGPAGPAYGDAVGQGGRAVDLVYWSSKLIPYYPLNWTNPAAACPGYRGQTTGPFIRGAIDRQGSYAYNTWGARIDDETNEYVGLGPVIFWQDSQGKFVPAVSEARITEPAELLAVGDSKMPSNSLGGDDIWSCDTSWRASNSIYPARHGKNYNQLYGDGHVSGLPPSVVFNPSNSAACWNIDHQPHPELWLR